MDKVSIITVNYNGLSDTLALLKSLYEYGYGDCEIIVIDNGSRVNEALLISDSYPEVVSLRSEVNLGFAGGNNIGIKVATCDYLLFLNNDTVVSGGFLEPLCLRIQSDVQIGMVCPKLYYWDAPDMIQSTGFTDLSKVTLRNKLVGEREMDLGQYQLARQIPFAHGAAMLVRKSVVEEVGVMPEAYFLYYEELDWCLQIRKAGYTLWYEPLSYIYHKESASTGRVSSLKNYYMSRNRIYFAKRNLKGIFLYLSLGYQLCISLPKNCIVSIMNNRLDLMRSSLLGVRDGLWRV